MIDYASPQLYHTPSTKDKGKKTVPSPSTMWVIVWQGIGFLTNALFDPEAAYRLLGDLESAISLLAELPYAHPLHPSPLRLPRETRFLPVRNYLVFYVVTEPQQSVEIQSVVHNRMNRAAITVEAIGRVPSSGERL